LPDHVLKILREPDNTPPPKHPEAHVVAIQTPSTDPCKQMEAYGQCQFAEDCRYAHAAEIAPADIASLLQETEHAHTIPLPSPRDGLARITDVGGSLHDDLPSTSKPEGGGAENTPAKNLPINGQYHWDETTRTTADYASDVPDLISDTEDDDSGYDSDPADDTQSDSSDDCHSTLGNMEYLQCRARPDLTEAKRQLDTVGIAARDIAALDIAAADPHEATLQLDIAAAFYNVPLNWEVHH
jgi:hypothetical protein